MVGQLFFLCKINLMIKLGHTIRQNISQDKPRMKYIYLGI